MVAFPISFGPNSSVIRARITSENRPLTAVFGQIRSKSRMWANAERDGGPAEYRWCPLFNAAMFG